MDAVVGGVHHDGVVGDPELVQRVEHLADAFVVLDHRVVVFALPAARLPSDLVFDVGPEVHCGGVEPEEERLACLVRLAHEPLRLGRDLLVDGLHSLLRQRTRVLDPLCPVLLGPAVQHAARPEPLEVRRLLGCRVVDVLRLLLCVEVIQVPEELVESVVGRQHLVAVAEVVLAELSGDVPLLSQPRRDGRVVLVEPDRCPRQADFGQSGAVHALTGDERRSPCGARLLPVVVREQQPLLGDAVDVRSPVPHQTLRIAAQIADPDVIAPQNEDVRFPVRHGGLLVGHGWGRARACHRRERPAIPLCGGRWPAVEPLSAAFAGDPHWLPEVVAAPAGGARVEPRAAAPRRA